MANLFALASPLLLSCTVAIKDNRFYADAGPDGAFWFQSLSKEQGKLTKKEWDKLRFGMICEKTDVFANLKEAVDTLCQNSGACDYQMQQKENEFFERLNKIGK